MDKDAITPGQRRHPIQVVARRTGLTPEVLRIWEKRYGIVEPSRTPTGRRVYSDTDIERLLLIRRATLMGRRVGEVSGLSPVALAALVREDEQAVTEAPAIPGDEANTSEAGPEIQESLGAIRELDAPRLEAILTRTLMTFGSAAFIERLVAPLLAKIGEEWKTGRLSPYEEHLAIPVIRQTVGRMLQWATLEPLAPVIVVTTPAGQRHEIGAIMAASAALSGGWRAVYLGPDLPAAEIARAAELARAKAVAISIVYPADDPKMAEEISQLRRLLGKDVAVVAGGAAAPAYARALKKAGAEIVPDFRSFRTVLERLRGSGTSNR
jgi:MerR family transcriptional regulator, light-induced transcriptional regulator